MGDEPRDGVNRCYWCGRPDDELTVNVDVGGVIRSCCDTCWSRQDVEIPLDYTEDEE
jgi:hypothetical protein